MELKEIDKLFGDRLKHTAPTPPAALWDRLQERIETEMPAPQQAEEPPIKLWSKRYYSIAAAITVLLATGIIFSYLNNQLPANHHAIAKADAFIKEVPAAVLTPASTDTTLAVTGKVDMQESTTSEITAVPATKPTAPSQLLAQAAPRASENKKAPAPGVEKGKQAPAQTMATITPTIATPDEEELPQHTLTPAAGFASAASVEPAQPVEIIIKRSSSEQVVAATGTEQEEEELSGFEKKQRLAKGIIRQARNLTNGERVDLSDIGINASRIALETQIGKQKFSKVFNL